ncbi:unnamed protein product, partial [Ectocarpus fasciculatus]
RNIKLENVLLSEDGERIKLTDFELATHLDEWEGGSSQDGRKSWRTRNSHRRQQTTGRTAAYVAPEVIAASEDLRYDARGVDTWCAGLCLFALVTGNLPFRAKGTEATLGIIQTMEPTYPEGLPPLLTDLLRGMLRKDPSKRLSVPAVMGHPWTCARLNIAVDLEEQTHLARVAIQEAKLAALEAERKAALALAAQSSAALALAAAGDASAAVETPAAAQGEEDRHDVRGISRSRSGSGTRSLGGQAGGPDPASKAPGREETAAARKVGSSPSANQGGGRNFARLLRRRASMDEIGGGEPPAPAPAKPAQPSSQRGRAGGTGRGGGGGRPAIQRSASVGGRRDDVPVGPRRDSEWTTPPRDRAYSASDSTLGGPEPAAPAAPEGGESGVAGGGDSARGPVVAGSVFAGTAESAAAAAAAAAGSAAVARRKMLRRSQSAVPSKGPVTNDTRGAAADTAAAATVTEEVLGKGPSSSSSSSSSSVAASKLVKKSSRSGIGKRGGSIRSKIRRSLSSVFGPNSSTSSSALPDPAPLPVPLPPPIEHSTSLDSVLAPGAAKTPRAGASGGVSAVPPAIGRCVSFDLVVPATNSTSTAAAYTSASSSAGAASTPPPMQPKADETSLAGGTADGQAAAAAAAPPEAVTVRAGRPTAAPQQPSALSRFLASTQREKKKMARSVTPEAEPEEPPAAAATTVAAATDGDGGGGSVDGFSPEGGRQEHPRSSSSGLTRAPSSEPIQGANYSSTKSPPAGEARAVSEAAAEASVSAAAAGGPRGGNGAPGKMDELDVSTEAPAAGTPGDLAATGSASAGSNPSHSVAAAAAAAVRSHVDPASFADDCVPAAAAAALVTVTAVVDTSALADDGDATAASNFDMQTSAKTRTLPGFEEEAKPAAGDPATEPVVDEATSAMASLLEDGYPPGLPGARSGPGGLPIVLEGFACEPTVPALGAPVANGSPPKLSSGSFSSTTHRRAPADHPKAYLRSCSEVSEATSDYEDAANESEATSDYEDPANEFDDITRAVLAGVTDLEEGDEPAGLTYVGSAGAVLPSPDGERPLAGLSILSRMGGTAPAERETEEPARQDLQVDLPPTTPDGKETLAGLSILQYSDDKEKEAAAAAAAAAMVAIDGVSALDNLTEDNDLIASESKAVEGAP